MIDKTDSSSNPDDKQENLQPNLADMARHMHLLYDWTHTHYPYAVFEVRVLGQETTNERFDCSPSGIEQAVRYAEKYNEIGCNVYVTINPLKTGTNHTARDRDVELAIYQFIDVDGVDDPATLIAQRCKGYDASLICVTGNIPHPRMHAYWKRSQPIQTDEWTATQKGLANHFDSDRAVKNPSRIVRLAGSVNYPPAKKLTKGYIPEVTYLLEGDSEVIGDAFTLAFPPPVEPQAPPPNPSMDMGGKVPLYVIQAAFDAIRPIMGKGNDGRNKWLDIQMSAKDANASSWHIFDAWQRQSDRYDPADRTWEINKAPSQGSYLGLFKWAKRGDPDWWRHDDDVCEWYRQYQADRAATNDEQANADLDMDSDPDEDPNFDEGIDEEPEPPKYRSNAPPVFDPFEPTDITDLDLTKLKPRRWLYGRLLVRGYVSCLVGSGGVGKTSLAMGINMSIALGRNVLGDDDEFHTVRKQGAVMFYNLEDPLDEMKLRLAAEIKHRQIDAKDLKAKFYLASGRDHPFCVAGMDKAGRPTRYDIQPAVDLIRQRGIVLLTVDPMVNAHGLDGNKNDVLAMVVDQFRRIATQADCAVLIIHHFRKGGQAGDAESSLGAVTLTNSCRVVETITGMTEEEATALGVNLLKRKHYVKKDNAKQNLAPRPLECDWYQYENVWLNNGDDEYPDGDQIGVLDRWYPQNPMDLLRWPQVKAVFDAIDRGIDPENGKSEDHREYYSASATAKKRYVGDLIASMLDLTPQEAKIVLAGWLKSRVLVNGSPYNSKQRSNQAAKRLAVAPEGRSEVMRRMAARA